MPDRVVYKYPIAGAGLKLSVPGPAKVVHFGLNEMNRPTAWIEHDHPERTNADRLTGEGYTTLELRIFATGEPIPAGDGWQHVDSLVMTPIGSFLVFHLYVGDVFL